MATSNLTLLELSDSLTLSPDEKLVRGELYDFLNDANYLTAHKSHVVLVTDYLKIPYAMLASKESLHSLRELAVLPFLHQNRKVLSRNQKINPIKIRVGRISCRGSENVFYIPEFV